MTVIKKSLNFKQVNDAAMGRLEDLLREWFPRGTLVDNKREFAVGNIHGDAGGADGGSFKINLRTGVWADMNGGEPSGGDIVSLYAHKYCAGNMGEACKELAAKLGMDAAAPASNVYPMPKREEADEWRQMVPPPDTALPSAPYLGGWKHVYIYRDQAGKVLRYVVRNDAVYDADVLKKKKMIRPITYGWLKDKAHPTGKEGWHYRHPDPPRGMYGLERLDGRDVLLQEGEGKADSVQARVASLACLSLTMGTAGKHENDLTPLAGRTVIMCGDADKGGQETAEDVAVQLLAMGCIVTLVDVGRMPPGWDLGNACSGFLRCKKSGKVIWQETPWDGEKIQAFIRENGERFYGKDREPEDEFPDDPGEMWNDALPAGRDPTTQPPIPLGYQNGTYFYLSPMTRQVEALARRSHTKQELIGIADLKWFEKLGMDFRGEKGGLDWDKIGNFLKASCTKVGFFNPDIIRGRGCWMDDGRAVLHMGDRLIVDGVSCPLILPGSVYRYEAAAPLKYVVADPLDKEAAGELAEICRLFRWEKPIYGTLMAGWMVCAPICGALPWRPTIWVTGGSGSGKSTLERLVVKPVLGGIGLFRQGGSTEAGIRQSLMRDARCVVFDEAEAETAVAKARIQGILDLVRQSSSEGGATIAKGTQSQTGAKNYEVRSCFMFSSINVSLEHFADESRVTILELRNPAGRDPAALAAFDALVARVNSSITPEFCAGFVARSVRMMPVILRNAETFARAVATHLGSSRVGDQIGTLLAGAFSLTSDRVVSPEAARKWVEAQCWDDTTTADAAPDERRMLDHLMQQRAKLDLGAGRTEDLMLGEIVLMASGKNGDAVAAFAQAELKRHGMKYEENTDELKRHGITAKAGVWVSNTHDALKKHFHGTQWSAKWERTLRRLPGTKALERGEAAIRFAGSRDRATFVPLDLIE